MKKKLKIWISISIALIVAVSATLLGVNGAINKSKKEFTYLKSLSNKVVLFIGDGMGQEHIKVAQAYLERDMFFVNFANRGEVTTHSLNKNEPTDSAASATAMATGKKVKTGAIASQNYLKLESISEIAKSNGLGVGIVTTDVLYGATPAAFSSHAVNRDEKESIINSQVTRNLDLYMGAGLGTYSIIEPKIKKTGYSFCSTFDQLNINDNKILASFTSINTKDGTNEMPTLSMMVEFAIDFMELHFPNGYFLMVEGAHIDKNAEKNNIFEMLDCMDEFDNAIKLAHTKLENVKNHTLIVTADHETGDLKYNNQTKEEIGSYMFGSNTHTTKNVGYYIEFNTTKQPKHKLPDIIDNTDIFKILNNLLYK